MGRRSFSLERIRLSVVQLGHDEEEEEEEEEDDDMC